MSYARRRTANNPHVRSRVRRTALASGSTSRTLSGRMVTSFSVLRRARRRLRAGAIALRLCRDDRAHLVTRTGLEALRFGRRPGSRTNGLRPAHERRALSHKHAPLGRFDLPGVEAFHVLRWEHVVAIATRMRSTWPASREVDSSGRRRLFVDFSHPWFHELSSKLLMDARMAISP